MARATGQTGKVYGQNPPDMMDWARNAYEERAKSPAIKNVTTLMRGYEDPVALARDGEPRRGQGRLGVNLCLRLALLRGPLFPDERTFTR